MYIEEPRKIIEESKSSHRRYNRKTSTRSSSKRKSKVRSTSSTPETAEIDHYKQSHNSITMTASTKCYYKCKRLGHIRKHCTFKKYRKQQAKHFVIFNFNGPIDNNTFAK